MADHDSSIDTRLHRYFDGDLPEPEAAELRAAITEDSELALKLESLTELRDLIRESVQVSSSDVATDALWSRIAAQTGQTAQPVAHVSPLRAPEKKKKTTRSRWAVPAWTAVGLAAAASALLYLNPSTPTDVSPEEAEELAAAAESGALEAVPPEAEGELALEDEEQASAWDLMANTEVVEVEFGDKSGALFTVETEEGEQHAVLWLPDDGEDDAVWETEPSE